MNRLKKNNAPSRKAESAPERSKSLRAAGTALRRFMDGSFLFGDDAIKQLPFTLFIATLTLLYIANTHNAEKRIRQTNSMSKEIKNLKSEYISLKSQLILNSNPSQIATQLAPAGILESKEPLGGTLFYTETPK